jgi:hypothetical protein
MISLYGSHWNCDATTHDIENYLYSSLKMMSLTYIRLKAKFDSYASFHVSVNEKDFPPINTGVKHRFYGRLNPDQIYSSEEPILLTLARTTPRAALSSGSEANEGDQSVSTVKRSLI